MGFCNKRKIAIVALSILTAAFLSYHWLDRTAALYFHRHLRFESLFETVTFFGRAEVYLIVSAILFFYFRHTHQEEQKQKALFLFSAVAVSGIVVDIIKVIAGRFRPNMLWNHDLYGFDFWHFKHNYISFPSGHSAAAFAAMTALALMWPRYRVWFLTAAFLIALSRVVLAAHYISDVLAGAFLGWAATCLIYRHVFNHGWKVDFVAKRKTYDTKQ